MGGYCGVGSLSRILNASRLEVKEHDDLFLPHPPIWGVFLICSASSNAELFDMPPASPSIVWRGCFCYRACAILNRFLKNYRRALAYRTGRIRPLYFGLKCFRLCSGERSRALTDYIALTAVGDVVCMLQGLLHCPFMSRHALLCSQKSGAGPTATFSCKVIGRGSTPVLIDCFFPRLLSLYTSWIFFFKRFRAVLIYFSCSHLHSLKIRRNILP